MADETKRQESSTSAGGEGDEAEKQFAIASTLDLTPAENSKLAQMEAVHG
jgi:hypothetical protein